MLVTKNTTLESLNDASLHWLEDARAELAQHATEGHNASTLTTYLNRLAETEAKRAVFSAVLRVHEHSGKAQAMEYLFGLLTRGADDTWSGRGNDVNRAAFDGVRAAAETAFRVLDRMED